MEDEASRWWLVNVYDAKSRTYTELNRFGILDDIIEDLESEGLWQFVSAEEEENQ